MKQGREFQFNGQRIEFSPNDDNEYSVSGESIKEQHSHEELAQFANNDPEKEHNSCPQMQLKPLHQVIIKPSLKRVESAGNIAEEADEEVQAVRGKHILGSGKNLINQDYLTL